MEITFHDEGVHLDTPAVGETVTVAALIEALQQCDPTLPVITEGCDRTGTILSLSQDGQEVYLRRTR